MAIREEFKAWQKIHPNFMTPKVRRTITVEDKVIEVSEGMGFEHEDIYGVSVFERVGEFKFERDRTYKGKLFRDFNKALVYAEELAREMFSEARRGGAPARSPLGPLGYGITQSEVQPLRRPVPVKEYTRRRYYRRQR